MNFSWDLVEVVQGRLDYHYNPPPPHFFSFVSLPFLVESQFFCWLVINCSLSAPLWGEGTPLTTNVDNKEREGHNWREERPLKQRRTAMALPRSNTERTQVKQHGKDEGENEGCP